ncbi:MAG: diguanylate cyclase, partial [Herbinix sp.]|nr:diguanylate cyclase [Herbinix sp.]
MEGIIINIIVLLSASTISSILFAKYKNKIHFRGIFQGIIIGFLGILIMTNAISSSSGMIFDTRSILVSTLAMFFGIVSTCIAVFIISFYRIMIGGTGAFAGILMTIVVAVMGILWNRFRLSVIKKNIWIEFYAFGIATNVIVLLCALTLQQGMTLKVLKEISAIVLIIYPIVIVLICSIIFKGFQAVWVQSEPNNNKRGREPLKIETISNYFMNKFNMKLDQPINMINKSVAALNESVQANNTYLYMNQDVLEINKTKEALQKKQILIMSLLNVIPDLVFYKDCEGVYMGCNKAFEKFVGTSENEIVGKTDFDLFDKEVATKFRVMDVKMIKQKSNRRNEETVTYPDGTQVRLDTLKTPYYDSQGNTLGLIGVSRNISELKLKEAKIIYLNYHDSLTDLYNHTFFDKEMRRINARGQVPVSIIIGDLNGLKLINDVFGYVEGDRVLKETAKIFRNCCHMTDVIARTEGDEFKVLLPGVNATYAKTILKSI